MFPHPTYIVLELPSPVDAEIQRLRRHYDPHLATYPAEITVAGSSGLGTLGPEEDYDAVLGTLQTLARVHLPIRMRFVATRRFASGPVIWLAPEDPAPFVALHQGIAQSGLSFRPHKFPYTPHCSLTTSELDPEKTKALLAEPFPRDPFALTRLSLYAVVDRTPKRLVTL